MKSALCAGEIFRLQRKVKVNFLALLGNYFILCFSFFYSISAISGVFGDAEDGLAVYLEGAGGVESDCYLVALDDVDIFCMSGVGALEYFGEDGDDAGAGKIVRDREAELAFGVKSVLSGSDHHSAAEESAVHRGCEPYLFVFLCHTVNGDGRVSGSEIVEQALDGYRRVIDGLICLCADLVALFAGVAVDAVADVVDKAVFLAVHADDGEIGYVFFNVKGRIAALLAEVVEEIIAASRAVIVDLLLDLEPAGIIYKMVECTVTAREYHGAIVIAGNEKIIKTAECGDVNESDLTVGQHRFKLARRLLCPSVICKRIIQYNIILQGMILQNTN